MLHIEAHFCNEHSTRVVPGGWRDDPAESPGGGLTGAGLHLIDALVSLGGPIAEVHARLFERKPPPDPRDVIALQAQFASGATGQLASVRAAPAYWRVHVFGTKGWAEARDETTLTVALNGQSPQTQTLPPVDLLAVLLEAFGEAIELGTPFPVTTDEMLAVVARVRGRDRVDRAGKPVRVAQLTRLLPPHHQHEHDRKPDVAVYIMKALR